MRFKELNSWYDGLEEPWRFLTMLFAVGGVFIISPWFVPVDDVPVKYKGVVLWWMLFVTLWCISRIIAIHKTLDYLLFWGSLALLVQHVIRYFIVK